MNLYRVEATIVLYVGADTDAEAERLTELRLAREALAAGGAEIEATATEQPSSLAGVDPEWHDALVYHAGTQAVTVRSLVTP